MTLRSFGLSDRWHLRWEMRFMRSIVLFRSCASLLAASLSLEGCVGQGTTVHAADDKALRDLVDRTVAAAGRRDFATYARYYAPQTTLVLPGQAITSTDGRRIIELPPGYTIRMVTVETGFSAAGDLGYALGTYEQTAPDKSGVLTNSVGKWMSVFRKQPDGSWGAVADTFNVDP